MTNTRTSSRLRQRRYKKAKMEELGGEKKKIEEEEEEPEKETEDGGENATKLEIDVKNNCHTQEGDSNS